MIIADGTRRERHRLPRRQLRDDPGLGRLQAARAARQAEPAAGAVPRADAGLDQGS
jgi:hypothetical protein